MSVDNSSHNNYMGGAAAGAGAGNDFADIDWDSVAFSFDPSARALSPPPNLSGDVRLSNSDEDFAGDGLDGNPRFKKQKRRPSDMNAYGFHDYDASLFNPNSAIDGTLFREDDVLNGSATSASKLDYLQARIAQLEAQNSTLQEQLSTAERLVGDTKRRCDERLSNVRYMFHLFNTGNMDSVRKAMAELTSPDCALLTPSLFQQLQGQNAVLQFFMIMLDTFPDGMFDLTESTMEDSGVFVSKFSFTGTKVGQLPSDVLFEKWKDLSLAQISKKQRILQQQQEQQQQQGPGLGSGKIQDTFLSILSGDQEKLQHLPKIAQQIRQALGMADTKASSSTPILDLLQSQRGMHDAMLTDRVALLQRITAIAGGVTGASMSGGIGGVMPTTATAGPSSSPATPSDLSLPKVPFPIISQLLANYKNATSSSGAPSPAQELPAIKTEPMPAASVSSQAGGSGASHQNQKEQQQQSGGAQSTAGAAASAAPEVALPVITLNGHIMATYVRNSTKINRLVFVWNTTSLIGQAFGFSNGDLEVLNGMKGALFAQRTADSQRQQK